MNVRARGAALVLAALVSVAAGPANAQAHGPVAPIASAYLARVSSLPAGVHATVVDGDQRMWVQVAPAQTVIVLDYRGAPYLRFSRSGIAVNRNSEMYYLNQSPAEAPPAALRPATPPHWSQVSAGHEYGWHDGRLHALATVAVPPGTAYIGRWSIPLRVAGAPRVISGGLWHAQDPSPVWFWPIVVLVMCTLAARRTRRPELDARVARSLAFPALAGIALAALARQLHGRPTVSVTQWVTLVILAAFVVWALRQLIFRRPTYITYFVIAGVALWQGAQLIPALLNGFVLAAIPAVLVRVAAVVCLGCGIALLVIPARLADDPADEPDGAEDEHVERPGGGASIRESYA